MGLGWREAASGFIADGSLDAWPGKTWCVRRCSVAAVYSRNDSCFIDEALKWADESQIQTSVRFVEIKKRTENFKTFRTDRDIYGSMHR